MATIKVPCMNQNPEKPCLRCLYRSWLHCDAWTDVPIGSLLARKWEGVLQRAAAYWAAVEKEMEYLSEVYDTTRAVCRQQAIINVNLKTSMTP
jgi:hypothetical protein